MEESVTLAMKRKGSLDPTQKWRIEGQALFELGKKKDAGEQVGFSGLHPARWYQPIMPGDSTMMVMDKFYRVFQEIVVCC